MSLDPSPSERELLTMAEQRGAKSWREPIAYHEQKPIRVRTRAPVPDKYDGMNKTEMARAKELEAMKDRGEIVDWWYNDVTLRIADNCRITLDFLIQENDGHLRFEETKGWWREDALIKTKVAATKFPFPITALKKRKGGGWIITPIHR